MTPPAPRITATWRRLAISSRATARDTPTLTGACSSTADNDQARCLPHAAITTFSPTLKLAVAPDRCSVDVSQPGNPRAHDAGFLTFAVGHPAVVRVARLDRRWRSQDSP